MSSCLIEGWLYFKARSHTTALNILRPRKKRWGVLQPNGILIIYKFKPEAKDTPLSRKSSPTSSPRSGTTSFNHPVGQYVIQSFSIWPESSRKYGLVVSAKSLDETNTTKELEINLLSPTDFISWQTFLTNSITITPPISSAKSNPSIKSSNTTTNTARRTASDGATKAPLVSIETDSMITLGASVHRGLENNTGENNCFLNVLIQSFWHLRPMKALILSSKTSSSNSVILSTLYDILSAYQDKTDERSLNARTLRTSLIKLLAEQTFTHGRMCDAEETLLTLLNLLEDAGSDIPDKVFGHQIYDKVISCKECNSTENSNSSWDLYSNLVFSIYAPSVDANTNNMSEFLHTLKEEGSHCENCSTRRCMRKVPKVFALSILWATSRAEKDQVTSILNLLPSDLNLKNAFEIEDKSTSTSHVFRGMVCYYGKHYFAFFYSTAQSCWLLFDDLKVARVGDWEEVRKKCITGRYQPVLLFYEKREYRNKINARADSSVDIEYGVEEAEEKSGMMIVNDGVSIGEKYDVGFSEVELGIELVSCKGKLRVVKTSSESVRLFDIVVSAADYPISHYPVDRATELFRVQSRPLVIKFQRCDELMRLVEDHGFAYNDAVTALNLYLDDFTKALKYCNELKPPL